MNATITKMTMRRSRQRANYRRRRSKNYSSRSIFITSRVFTISLCLILAMTGIKTMRYCDSNNNNNNSNNDRNNYFGNNNHLSMFVSAMKPIRNLHVTYRGQTYTIREGVSTVNELTARFERLNNNLGNMGNDKVSPKGIVWKGQILKQGDDLSKAGIKHGDRVMILPGDKETKAVDILAVYLFLLSSNEKAIEDAISKIKQEQPEAVEAMKEMMNSFRDGMNSMTSKDVSNFMRSAFDLSYHRLRSWWEHPSLRQGLHDPERIENYRKVVSTNLSTKFLKKMSSSSSSQLQKIIKSPELWRREFSKIATKAIRFGDTILEGFLSLLLDVLKGRGSSSSSSSASQNNPYFSSLVAGQQPQQYPLSKDNRSSPQLNSELGVTNEMEDPSLANNLLFELSESEDDSDLDEL